MAEGKNGRRSRRVSCKEIDRSALSLLRARAARSRDVVPAARHFPAPRNFQSPPAQKRPLPGAVSECGNIYPVRDEIPPRRMQPCFCEDFPKPLLRRRFSIYIRLSAFWHAGCLSRMGFSVFRCPQQGTALHPHFFRRFVLKGRHCPRMRRRNRPPGGNRG